jgi:hypothetical protein
MTAAREGGSGTRRQRRLASPVDGGCRSADGAAMPRSGSDEQLLDAVDAAPAASLTRR